ncbi:hypothetical protein CC86DRAFT_388994 [Ophiobolus disseminans]|uniref:MYND-type domain-containing protein n=1 Tax=Ophiobolus disseminans TaxID=1469910 RepID=A0A6A6ZBK5_9PLEO|nr:hypothetical protein CC86DRAFT_388994 [Ophiobolus disseminans]
MTTLTANELSDLCTMCNEAGALTCGGCGSIRYRGKGCQKLGLPLHKLLCKTVNDFHEDMRPISIRTRAIYFGDDKPESRFIWLAITEESPGVLVMNLFPLTPDEEPANFVVMKDFDDSRVLGRPLGKAIRIMSSGRKRDDGSYEGIGQRPKSWEKIDKDIISRGYRSNEEDKVECLEVNCLGDQVVLNRPPVYEVGVGRSAFPKDLSPHEHGQLSARAGVPLIILDCSCSQSWTHLKYRDGKHRHENQFCPSLTRNPFPTPTTKGRPPTEPMATLIQDEPHYHGSFLVARADKKQLSPLDFASTMAYIDEIALAYAAAMNVHNSDYDPEALYARLTKESF